MVQGSSVQRVVEVVQELCAQYQMCDEVIIGVAARKLRQLNLTAEEIQDVLAERMGAVESLATWFAYIDTERAMPQPGEDLTGVQRMAIMDTKVRLRKV